jgi:hypothetical protein
MSPRLALIVEVGELVARLTGAGCWVTAGPAAWLRPEPGERALRWSWRVGQVAIRLQAVVLSGALPATTRRAYTSIQMSIPSRERLVASGNTSAPEQTWET